MGMPTRTLHSCIVAGTTRTEIKEKEMFIEALVALKLAQIALRKLKESNQRAERFRQTNKIAKKYAKAASTHKVTRRRKGGLTLGRALLLPLLAITAVVTAKPRRKPAETLPGSRWQDPSDRYKF